MKKLKLLMGIAALLLGGANSVNAQTDVTSTYLTNADFSRGTAITTDVYGYGKDGTPYGLQDVTGWSKVVLAGDNSNATYPNSGMAGGIFSYGSTNLLRGNAKGAPATNPTGGSTGNCLGFVAVWNCGAYYYQDVTLPSGTYKITVPTYNQSGTNDNTSFIGFITDNGGKFVGKTNTSVGAWETLTIDFSLTEETKGKIALGYTAQNNGAAANPHLFFDNVSISYSSEITYPIDMTGWIANPEISGSTSWTCDRPNGGNGPLLNNVSFEYWGGNATGGTAGGSFDYYQTITGLPAGKYTVSAEMYNSLNGEDGAVFSATSGVYASNTGGNQVYKLVNVDGTDLIRYTTDEINVIDGTLRVGVKNISTMTARWFVADNFKLTMTAAPDLSDYVSEYQTALAKAKAVDQTKTMAASIKAALQNAISTYGSVDETSVRDLITATNALGTATTNANKSIASYAIIAAGTIPDNSIDGWVCENTNTFQINTWSVEGNSDGSNMVTPFIENWVGKGSYLGVGKVYYKLEGLEPGEVYYAQALVRSYNEANSDAPNGPDFFINDVVTSLASDGTTFTYNGMSGIYATLGGAATVGSNGTLTLGIEIASDRNYNWVAFKNVSIQSMDGAFNAAVAKVTALEGTIPTAAYNKAYAVVTANSGANYPTTASGFETAIVAIEAAATTAAECVEPYATYKELKNDVQALYDVTSYEELTTGSHETLGTAISTAETNVAAAENVTAINNVTSTLKTAGATYAGAANPVGDGTKFDLTFMLTNPDLSDFAAWQKSIAGWYTDQTFSGQNFQTMSENTKMFMEYWSGENNATSGYVLYQKLNLEPGTYNMIAQCKAGWGASATNENGTQAITFSAGGTDGTNITSTTLADASIDFVQSASGEVKIGLKAHEGNTCNWMGIGYVKLFKVPAAAPVELNENSAYDFSYAGAATAKLTREIYAGFNTVMLPFSLSASEITTVFGEGTLYAFTGADAGSLNFATSATLQANTPYLFKADAAKSLTALEIEARTFIAAAAAQVSTSGTDYNFVGTYTPYEKNAGANPIVVGADYVLGSDDNFHLTTAKNALKAFRAYIQANESDEPAPARLSIVIDGETTAIEAIDGRVLSNGAIFNLAGQKVKNAQKGIFIQNGKKVVK